MDALAKWIWRLAAFALLGGELAALAHDSFERRELAETRLAAAGWFAVPVLEDGCRAKDPERAFRCRRLAAKWLMRWDELRAWWAIAAPDLPADPWQFFRDQSLRDWVRRIGETAGVDSEALFGLAEDEYWTFWGHHAEAWWGAVNALDRCRQWIRRQ